MFKFLKRKEKQLPNVGEQVSEKDQKYYKGKIRTFFNGSRFGDNPRIKGVSIATLGITNITFLKFKEHLEITITLVKPGNLIGYHGNTVKSLSNYLSVGDEFVKITIVESKLWK